MLVTLPCCSRVAEDRGWLTSTGCIIPSTQMFSAVFSVDALFWALMWDTKIHTFCAYVSIFRGCFPRTFCLWFYYLSILLLPDLDEPVKWLVGFTYIPAITSLWRLSWWWLIVINQHQVFYSVLCLLEALPFPSVSQSHPCVKLWPSSNLFSVSQAWICSSSSVRVSRIDHPGRICHPKICHIGISVILSWR